MNAIVDARDASAEYVARLEPRLLTGFAELATSTGGVSRLRELIRTLAVRGRLLPQDFRDRPASSLLDVLQVEKQRLIDAGAIRRDRVPEGNEDLTLDFELPSGWELVQLDDVAWPQAGFAFKSSAFNESGEGLPLIRIRDVGSDAPTTFFSGEFRHEFIVRQGDWLIGMDGDFRVAPWKGPNALLNQRVTRLIFFGHAVQPLYICLALQQELRKLQGTKAYTTVDHLSGGQIASRVLPLPPLAEQQRIVARVEELMKLCDALEESGQLADEQHARLTTTLFDALAASESPHALAENWRRVTEHFDLLLDRPEAIDALDRTILALSIQGRLVPHELTDLSTAPNSRLQGGATAAPIDESEIPFDIPTGWQWIRLGWVAELINGDRGTNYPNRDEYVASGLPFINTGHIEPDGTLSQTSMNYLTRKKFDSLRSGKTLPGDLVYCLRGATLGKTAVVEYAEGAIASSLVIIRLNEVVDRKYAYYFLIGPLGRDLIKRFDNGSAQPNLAANSVKRYVMPLPPIAEQRRIVARVEELRSLCASLRQCLMRSQETQSRLADALVAEVA